MTSAQSHCRLCAEPYASSRLVRLEDEVKDIKKKMLLINIDVSAPSPLPRGVCYSCVFLLERTYAFLYQVSAAQRKLAQIYQDNNDVVEEDINSGVTQKPQDIERAEIKKEPCHNELPRETAATITESPLKGGQGKIENNSYVYGQNIVIKIAELFPEGESDAKEKRPRRGYCVRPEAESYTCHVCGKVYKKRQALTGHMKCHKEKPFVCDVCNKSFIRKDTLNCHMTMHTGERPYSCETCGIAFRFKQQLNMHANIHTGEKPHVCSCCSKAFRLKNTLNEHKMLHTGVKPYSCEFCGHQFRTQSQLYRHVRRVHGADPLKQKKSNVDTSVKNS